MFIQLRILKKPKASASGNFTLELSHVTHDTVHDITVLFSVIISAMR